MVWIHTAAGISPLGTGFDVLREVDLNHPRVPCVPAPSSVALPHAVGPAGWIDPIPRPDRWPGKPVRFARLDRLAQLSLVAAQQALAAAGHGLPSPPERVGVALGSAFGAHLSNELFQAGLAGGPVGASPALFPYTLPSSALGAITIHLRLMGPALSSAQGSTAGLQALADAAELVRLGRAASMLAVAADTLGSTLLRAAGPRAGALLEGAACLKISCDPRGAQARILGFSAAHGERASSDASRGALERSGLSGADLCASLEVGPAGPGWPPPMAHVPLLALGRHLHLGPRLPALVTVMDGLGCAASMCVGPP